MKQNTRNLEQQARQVAADPWVEKLARLGLVSKGIVYSIVGFLAAQAAFGAGGRTTDTAGALETIVTQPFGQFLLALVCIGFIGYTLWRFLEAFFNPENQGIGGRLGSFVSGVIYASLAFTAAKLALGYGGTTGGDATQDWTGRFLAQPFGQWLVGIAGAFIIGMGFYEMYKAYKAKFREYLKWQEMAQNERNWATRLGRLGYAARGVVFIAIGFFLIQAARLSNPNEARGFGGALAALAGQPYGPWILGLVAIGLLAYGIYTFVEAKYRRIRTA
ncbi:DUF1206 domain-containing protein [Phormidium sp. LEGE 05292]|uniref:DUF1206 domain-containing protein n=1 Tax=[Phormidium] sp. LEGE 05292 TaxID=767427 RepID=UPI00187FD03E|nr:DUF1206 domain-containing protein [Phormidium sp. LEGE 05292]MBE9224820.1 DUF1206 domain-containing protein [Phormidium sp. LEGE 05292]